MRTMKKLLLACLGCFVYGFSYALPEVPETLRFCDIELSLDADARATIAQTISKIKQSNLHFQALVDRANVYFPFVDEAFDLRGVPKDLKYIVIQESSLVADATSSSSAVGFWQFKEQSAREAGMVIDQWVDERKHIFLSSLGAAKYFYTIARYFDNYLYAVVGYNRGPVGAIPFTQTDDYGNRKMKLTGQTHWYALKAIAHKLAFEEAIGKTDPPMWLQPLNTDGETSVKKLAEANDLTVEEFKQYNLWIKGETLPEGNVYVYYVPRKGKPDLALMRHLRTNGKVVGGEQPPKVEVKPKPATLATRDNRKFTYLEPLLDVDYGVEYVRAKAGESLVEIAVHHGVKVKKLKEINGFDNSTRPKEGQLVYLKSPQARGFHIVDEGETLQGIAAKYELDEAKLRKKNRMTGNVLHVGQKISLKKRIAKGAKPTLLALPEAIEEEVVLQPEVTQPKVVDAKGILPTDPGSYRLPPYQSKLVTHTVGSGESIWKIAKKYGAYSEVIKKMNGLTSNELKVGMQLKVLQTVDL
jgi:membrane-bound lytic murein transglycosylase D